MNEPPVPYRMTAIRPPSGVLLDRALELYELGLRVIPLGDPWTRPPVFARDKDQDEPERLRAWCKKSRVAWKPYQDQNPTEEQIREWWTRWPYANIGVVTTGFVVVDSDTPEAEAWLAGGGINSTPLRTRTARGYHRWYRPGNGLSFHNAASANGIDIRATGGYVVAPGSTYADGTQAQWVVEEGWDLQDFHQLPELTAEDLGAIQRFGGNWSPTNPEGDPRGAVIADLGAVHVPHDGGPVLPGGRNNALASLVGQWISARMSLAEISQRALLWNRQNPKPLADAEVISVVVSILSTAVRGGTPMPDALPPPPPEGLEVLSFADLEDTPPPQPETFWRDGVMFRGARLLIAGPPKVGKSNFVIQLGMAAAAGGEFLCQRFERPLRVLWFQAEIHKAFLARRLERLACGLADEDRRLVRDNFWMTGRCDLDLRDANNLALVNDVIAGQAPDLVIFDPIINFSSGDENDNSEMRALLRAIDTLGERYRCAIAVVHHLRKDNSAGFDSVRGASALRGWFDTGLMLNGTPPNGVVLSYELRNAPPLAAGVLEVTEEGRFALCEMAPIHPGSSADPIIGGVRPRNPETHNQPNRASNRTPNPTHLPTQPNPTNQPIDTSEAHLITALEIVRRGSAHSLGEPIGYNDLTSQLRKILRVKSDRTIDSLITKLIERKLITRVKMGRQTFYTLTDPTFTEPTNLTQNLPTALANPTENDSIDPKRATPTALANPTEIAPTDPKMIN